jgi:hypothetical protein
LIGQEEHGVTGEEFPRLLALLEYTSLPKSVSGQLEIANMASLYYYLYVKDGVVVYYSSVVDPDPVESDTFSRIRISKKSFRIEAGPDPK